MSNVKKDNYELYYAYLHHDTNKFGTAHISLQIGNDKFNLIIQIDEPIELFDLQQLLLSLQDNQFNRMHIDITNDCEIFLNVNEHAYKIELIKENNVLKVLGMSDIRR